MKKEYQIYTPLLKKLLVDLESNYELSEIRHLCRAVSSELPRVISVREPSSIFSSVIDLSAPYNLNPSIETEVHTVGNLGSTVKLGNRQRLKTQPKVVARLPVKCSTFETGLQESAERISRYFDNVIMKPNERPKESEHY